jgi:hypothetical protein
MKGPTLQYVVFYTLQDSPASNVVLLPTGDGIGKFCSRIGAP